MKEVWKEIGIYKGYKVSSKGRVIGLKGGLLKPATSKNNYPRVSVVTDFKVKTVTVHRLMMIAFYGESELCVNHKNGIKTDNRLENLEYCTYKENTQHAYDTGLIKRRFSEDHPSAKLNKRQALDVHVRIKRGERNCDIAKIHGVSRKVIGQIKSGRTYKLENLRD